jgi:hypothetical protein
MQLVSITVNPKLVTITGLGAEDKTYDGTTDAEITGADAATIDGKLDGDNLTISHGTASFEDANAGDNKIVNFSGYTLSGSAAGNYTLSGQPASVTADIAKATLTVTASHNPIAYGDPVPTSFSISYEGFADSEDESIAEIIGLPSISTDYTEGSDVGEYGITLEDIGDLEAANYSFTLGENGTFTVEPKTITIKADNKTIVAGDEPEYTYTILGLVGGDELIEEPSLSSPEADINVPGTYQIVPSGGSAGDNYAISYESGILTVEASLESDNQSPIIAKAASASHGMSLLLSGNSLLIQGLSKAETVRIFSIKGNMLMSRTVAPSESLSIAHLPKGVYMVNIGGKTFKVAK